MGLRGPKPVDLGRLMDEAGHWATLFYALRDGQRPEVVGIETKDRTIGRGELLLLLARSATSPKAKAAREEMLRKIRNKDWNWVVSSPVMAAPEIWKRLKRARSAKDIQEVSRAIRRWASEYMPGEDWATRFPDALASQADKVLSAKRLPNYPKTNRARSDDKRIEFFSKVLAGLMLGIAPITAIKRLSHWHSQRDYIRKSSEKSDT
jgi:hypothetical protein